ncbi:DUF1801 domain-containing protein [Nevskia sp.]|uniref:DUF1801 domain-containing protein n=1 Tax=Nevskia sp. TaxID=1929292 RepID=UPI0025EE7DEE|nr:DUF1801 domain-containing protein [Nevskia sp.]
MANAAKLPPPEAGTAAVTAFMATLDHPQKAALAALRALILSVDPTIAEGIKWNAPSFRTADWFATFNLRAKTGIELILHFGAKAKGLGDVAIADPDGLLKWLAKDRAMLRIADAAALDRHQAAISAILRQWIAVLP